MTSSHSRTLVFALFVIPLALLGVWVWEETPNIDDPSSSGEPEPADPEALSIALARTGPGRIGITFANNSARKIAVVVPGRPAGVLTLAPPGAPSGPPRSLSFRPDSDALVELLPGGTYRQPYEVETGGRIEAVYDSRGPDLPRAAWRGLARSGACSDDEVRSDEGTGGR